MTKYILYIMLLLGLCPTVSVAQFAAWTAPAEASTKKNPLELSPKNVGEGKNVFTRSCIACHGDKADGKGLIKSANLISKEFQQQSDGVIFYKITTGRGQMPPFKSSLKEDEIWAAIHYLRVLVDPSSVPPAKDVKIDLQANDDKKSVTALVYAADSSKTPIAEMDVHFYVKRNFGLFRIGEKSNFTKADGRVSVVFPDHIIGDTTGNVTIVAKIENNLLYNNCEANVSKTWGTKLKTEDEFFNKRSLFGSRDKSPWWLLFLANGIIAGVWFVIAYVLLILLKIRKSGKIFFK